MERIKRRARAHLCYGAPDAIDQIFKIHQAEQRLLLEFVQLCSERVLLVLQDGAWKSAERHVL